MATVNNRYPVSVYNEPGAITMEPTVPGGDFPRFVRVIYAEVRDVMLLQIVYGGVESNLSKVALQDGTVVEFGQSTGRVYSVKLRSAMERHRAERIAAYVDEFSHLQSDGRFEKNIIFGMGLAEKVTTEFKKSRQSSSPKGNARGPRQARAVTS